MGAIRDQCWKPAHKNFHAGNMNKAAQGIDQNGHGTCSKDRIGSLNGCKWEISRGCCFNKPWAYYLWRYFQFLGSYDKQYRKRERVIHPSSRIADKGCSWSSGGLPSIRSNSASKTNTIMRTIAMPTAFFTPWLSPSRNAFIKLIWFEFLRLSSQASSRVSGWSCWGHKNLQTNFSHWMDINEAETRCRAIFGKILCRAMT